MTTSNVTREELVELAEVVASMRCAEACAGVGGMVQGFEAQGFDTTFVAEIDKYCRRILRHHFPDTRVYGDLLELVGRGRKLARKHGRPLVWAGGTPCQDLSVAGKRRGLRGAKSSLFYAFMEIWAELGSPLCLWENVPGALSSHGGKDFARVLGAFVGRSFAVPRNRRRGDRLKWPRAGVIAGPAGVAAWRVLDAQFFGVPQRRRRLFVLGSRSGLLDPRAILLDPEGVRGDPAAGEAAWEALAARLGLGPETARLRLARGAAGDGGDGRGGGAQAQAPEEGRADAGPVRVVGFDTYNQTTGDVAQTLCSRGPEDGGGNQHLVPTVLAFDYKQSAGDASVDVAPTLRATEHHLGNANGGGHTGIVQTAAFTKARRAHSDTDHETWVEAEVAPTLNASDLKGSDVRATTVIADPVSANEHRTWTHEGTTFRTHNVVVSDPEGGEAFGFKASHFTRGKDGQPSGVMPPLTADADKGDQDAVIFQPNDRVAGTVEATVGRSRGAGTPAPMLAVEQEVAPTVNGTQRQQVDGAMDVDQAVGIPRRLMPVECERLQGWPDGWTNVPKRAILHRSDAGLFDGAAFDEVSYTHPSDAKRYRAIGNGVAAPVAQWIAWRIRLAAAQAYLTLSGAEP